MARPLVNEVRRGGPDEHVIVQRNYSVYTELDRGKEKNYVCHDGVIVFEPTMLLRLNISRASA